MAVNLCRATIDYETTEESLTIVEVSRALLTKLSLDHIEAATLARDSVNVARIVKELGIDGRVHAKTVGDRTYLILKGHAGKRATIRGTRSLIDNPAIAFISVTPRQLLKAATRTSIIQIFAYTTINAIDAIFASEDKQLAHFLGQTAADALKVAAGSSVALVASMATASSMGVSIIAAGPVLVGIAVAVAAGAALDMVDRKYGLTERLIAATDAKLKELHGGLLHVPREFQRQWWRWERWFKDDPQTAMRALFGS